MVPEVGGRADGGVDVEQGDRPDEGIGPQHVDVAAGAGVRRIGGAVGQGPEAREGVRPVVLGERIVVRPLPILGADRQPRDHLLLDADGPDAVVLAREVGEVGVPRRARGHPEGRRRPRADLPVLGDVVVVAAVGVEPRADAVAAGVHDHVAVEPVARVADARPVGVAARQVAADIAHVLVPPELQRRPGVAEHVVDRAEPRREVGPEAGQLRRVAPGQDVGAHETALPLRRRRHRHGREVDPQPVVEGQAVDGPRVLREDAAVVVQLDRRVGGVGEDVHPVGEPGGAAGQPGGEVRVGGVVVAGDEVEDAPPRVRGRVVELQEVAVARPREAVVALGEVHPELEAVRPGDVRQRALVRPAVGVVVGLAIVLGAVDQAQVGVVLGDHAEPRVAAQRHRHLLQGLGRARVPVARRLDAQAHVGGPLLVDRPQRAVLVVAGVPVAEVEREAELGQHPVRHGPRPLRGPDVVVRRVPRRRRRLEVLAEGVLAEAALPHLVEHGRYLVLRRHLPRQPRVAVRDAVPVEGRGPVAVRAVEHPGVDDVPARRREEPQTVAHHRAADRGVEVVDDVELRHLVDAQAAYPLVDVVGLPRARRAAPEEAAAVLVAALVRDHVDAQPAGLRLRPLTRGRVRRLGREHRVQVGLVAAVADHRVDHHAVDLDGGVGGVEPAAHHLGLLRAGGAPHVGLVHLDPRNQQRVRPHAAPGRNRLLRLAGQHLDALHLLHVDHRRLARHRDGLLDRADRHHRVEGQGHVGPEDELVAHLGAEAGQGERDRVHARPQVDDVVVAGGVGEDDARAFDEDGAGRFDRHPGEHAAGVVRDRAPDRALRHGDRGRQQQDRRRACEEPSESHTRTSST